MTTDKFKEFCQRRHESGLGVMAFLRREGIAYSTYIGWKKKFSPHLESEAPDGAIVPVAIKKAHACRKPGVTTHTASISVVASATAIPYEGRIVLSFPNGVAVSLPGTSVDTASRMINMYGHVLPK